MRTVGAYDAKTHLPQLLEAVAKGETITITKRGVAVAVLAPPPAPRPDLAAVIAAMHRLRSGVTTGQTSIREMIEEGRP